MARHDDKNATELLKMLPEAFIVESREPTTADTLTLHFEPDPNFDAPDMQSRVLSAMNGELVVNEKQQRIQEISGRLTRDVTFGWGLLGRLHQGGTFRVERREIAPTVWEITETHVHIEGKALLFKNIGQQQDEVQTDFTQVPAGNDAGTGGGDVEAEEVSVASYILSFKMAKTPYPRTDRELIRRIERSAGQRAGYKQLVRELGLGGGRERRLLLEQLARMTARGELVKIDTEQWSLPAAAPEKTARAPRRCRAAGGASRDPRPPGGGTDRSASRRLWLRSAEREQRAAKTISLFRRMS